LEDRRNILLEEQPFSYKIIKGDKALISFYGKTIKTIVGKEYNKLIKVIQSANNYEIQLFLAKATGQFKHGNEKDNSKK
jgi:hypothetical protein